MILSFVGSDCLITHCISDKGIIFMHTDPFTALIFNTVAALLMSAGLFAVSRGYLGEVKGLCRWAMALLLLGIGCIFAALTHAFPILFEFGVGFTLNLLALAFFFHALVEFKGINTSVRWVYWFVVVVVVIHAAVFQITHSLAAKTVIAASSNTALMLANGFLLLVNEQKKIPISHKFTGYIFVCCACVLAGRVFYYGVWNTQPVLDLFQPSIIQDISTLSIYISEIITSFGFLLMCNDKYFSERKQAETELRIAATVFESQEGMFITNTNWVIIKVNQAFTAITGYSATDAIGKTPRLLNSGRHDKAFYQQIWQTINETDVWQGEIWNQRKNGEIYPEQATITAVRAGKDNQITHYVATFTDITERKAAEEEIRQLAFFDPLTGLPNRRKLLDRLEYAVTLNHRANSQFAVFMMDLDKFKAVNDALGHAAGDELLKQVAVRITEHLRDSDMVARLGGDEFVLVLENLKIPEAAEIIALKMIADLTVPFQLSDTDCVQIGASIGISIYPQHGSTPEILMDHADTALYQAKSNGRGCFAYFSDNGLNLL